MKMLQMDLVAWRGLIYTLFILNFVFVCQLLLLQPLVSALDGKSGDTAELFERVSQSIKVKRYSDAINDLNTAIEADPSLSEAYLRRASVLRQLCRYEESEKSYKKFLEMKPGNSAAEKELSQLHQAQSALDSAISLFDSGDYTKALDFIDKVVLIFSPACSQAKILKVKLLLATKDYAGAISEAGYILKEDEDNLDALLLRGRAYYYLADHDVATRHYQKGLRSDPEHSELKKAYFGLKNLLKKTKNAEDNEKKGKLRVAVEDYKAALALDPNHVAHNVHLHFGLCKLLVKLGRGKDALNSCTEVLTIDEEHVEALVQPLHEVTPTGTRLRVEGVLQVPPQDKKRKQRIELRVLKVLHVGSCDSETYPIPKTELKLEGLRDVLHLRPRTDTISAIARIRDELTHATHTFFYNHKFRLVPTPIITSTDCEGAGEMFQVTALINDAEKMEKDSLLKPEEGFKMKAGFLPKKDGKVDYGQDFFARQTFLSVSGQLQLEAYACALDNVYTFGPTFRAENSHTTRHLAEFWMVEPEMADADLEDIMELAEAYVRFMCQWLLDKCYDDMEFMVKMYDENAIQRLQMVASTKFIRLPYTEAIKVLKEAVFKGYKFEKKVEWGIDLASEHERYLTEEKFESPIIVYNYPKDLKAFYMKVNPDDDKTVAAMDVLVPKVGELIGGSQREEIYDVIKQRMLELGLPLEPYKWYLDLRRYGTVEHSGFGLGFERMVLFATGIGNIKDVIPFPRYPGRADM